MTLPTLTKPKKIIFNLKLDQEIRWKVWLAKWCKIQGIKITSNINNQYTVQHFLSTSTIRSVQFQRLIQQPKLKTRLIQKTKVSQHQQQLLSSTTTNQITSKPTSKQPQPQQQNTVNNLGTATGYGRGRVGLKSSYLITACFVGSSMVRRYFRSLGIRIQRDRIRKSLARIDPRNARIRWVITISRRAYCVPGPNSLWHLDGHHSLVSWGFVIHGAIDGYSRLITYLHCSTNNRSETVKELFLDAIQSFGLPSRVRTDRGGENVDVWQEMEQRGGPNRGSYLAGTSTHNQRIERLWRDVFRCVAHIFYYTFQVMEENGLLNMGNPTEKSALQFVFLPRTNRAITSFKTAWNYHPLRTEHNWSPQRIWSNGMVDIRNRNLTAVADVAEAEPAIDDLEWYGFDPAAPTPMDEESPTEQVDDATLLSDHILDQLRTMVNPLQESNRYGIDVYTHCLTTLQGLVTNE